MARFESIVALRYLRAARKRAHTAFLSLISTLGLAVGVATLLISLALLSGLQGKIKARLIASSPQLLIEARGGLGIERHDEVVRQLDSIAGGRSERIVSGLAWGANRVSRRGRPLRLRSFPQGQPPRAEESFGRLWRAPEGEGILLTRSYAAAIGLFVGDEIVVVSPRTKLTPFGPVPVWRTYRIVGLAAPQADEQTTDGYLPYPEASRLFGTEGNPTSIELTASTGDDQQIQASIEAAFPDLLVRGWRDLNRPLFLALRLEKIVMFATISLIIFVAALNLVSSLSMLIAEKRPQVGIMRTLGASERSILTIFLRVGLLIGLGGTALGNLIGLTVAWAADRYGLVPLPGEMYFVSHVPFTIELQDVAGVNAIAIILSVAATYYPARIASKLDPIVAIRGE